MIFLLLLSSFCVSITALGMSMLSNYAVNSIMYQTFTEYKTKVILAASAAFIGILSVLFFRHYLYHHINWIKGELEKKIYCTMLYKSLLGKSDVDKGKVFSGIMEDKEKLIKFLSVNLPEVLESIIVALLMGVTTFYFNQVMFAIVLILSLLSGTSVFLSRKLFKYEYFKLQQRDKEQQMSLNIFRSLEILHFYKNTRTILKEYNKLIETIGEIDKKKAYLSAVLVVLSYGCNLARELVVIIYGSLYAGFDIGMTVAMLNITSFFNSIISDMSDLIVAFSEVSVSIDRVYEIITIDNEKFPKEVQQLEQVHALEVDNLEYLYEENRGLKSLSCMFELGKVNTIVGNIGSGKSTFIKIMCGILVQQKGTILFNERSQDWGSLRRNTAYVDQENIILEGSILENITGFSDLPDIERAEKILIQVGLMEWVKQQENGIHHQLISENINLSGGQKQRLSIARAIYKNAPILLFDEPTASLDAESKERILNLIQMLKNIKLVVVVTHDACVIEKSDVVVKML